MSIYNNIPAMACKCQDTAERDEILRQLKEWGVPLSSDWQLMDRNLIISWEDEKRLLTLTYSKYADGEIIPQSDFLSAFREVYEGNQKQAAIRNATVVNNYGENYGNTSKDNTIVFPSDEEVEELLKDIIKFDNKLLIGPAIDRYKQGLLKLNPHLKV